MTEKELQERLEAGWAIDCGEKHELARDVTEFLLELGYKHGMYASREILDGEHSRWRYAYITWSYCRLGVHQEPGHIEYYNDSFDLFDDDKIISENVIKAMLYGRVTERDEEFSAALDELMQ